MRYVYTYLHYITYAWASETESSHPILTLFLPQVAVAAIHQMTHDHAQDCEQISLAALPLLHCGGFSNLVSCMQSTEDESCRDMATAVLLRLASCPEVPQSLADAGQVAVLVHVIATPRDAAVRMCALLVLARLATSNAACQMDAVRVSTPVRHHASTNVQAVSTHSECICLVLQVVYVLQFLFLFCFHKL